MLYTDINSIDTSSLKLNKSIIEKLARLCLNSIINNSHHVGVRVSVTGLEAEHDAYQESANRLKAQYYSKFSATGPSEPFHYVALRTGDCWGNLKQLMAELKNNNILDHDIDSALKFIIENMGKFAYVMRYYLSNSLELKKAY